jgi:hypothetical protein
MSSNWTLHPTCRHADKHAETSWGGQGGGSGGPAEGGGSQEGGAGVAPEAGPHQGGAAPAGGPASLLSPLDRCCLAKPDGRALCGQRFVRTTKACELCVFVIPLGGGREGWSLETWPNTAEVAAAACCVVAYVG